MALFDQKDKNENNLARSESIVASIDQETPLTVSETIYQPGLP